MSRRVVVVAVPDAQILDVTGPLEVFSTACRERAERGRGGPPYVLELAATAPGPLSTSCGVELVAQRALGRLQPPIDTLLVAGGLGVREALADRALARHLRRLAPAVRRLGAVCTGTFLLAEAGLLVGRRVTTHWGSCEALAARYPELVVEPDPIFVRDGPVYTSAGVTAGMDLALALVEEDLGRDLALAVARRLVLFLKRPGGQSQFSVRLDAQRTPPGPTARALDWICEEPGGDLSVAHLARRAGLSPRHFARVFTRETGVTPARFVERTRVEAARAELEESDRGIDEIAAVCGFGSAETMRRSFLRQLRVGPAEYRQRFRSAGPSPRAEEVA